MKRRITSELIAQYKSEPPHRWVEVRDTEAVGLILRVQPSGVASYYFDYRRPTGKRTRIKLGAADVAPTEARKQVLKHKTTLLAGRDPRAEQVEVKARSAKDKLGTLQGFIEHKYGP
jgi:hypothetical protein